jgi:hypothetical protein
MEIPTPPTDNLYKFMAISGLLLLAASIYFPFSLQIKLNDQTLDNLESFNTANADLDYYGEKVNFLNEIITNSIQEQEGKSKDDKSKVTLVYSQSEVKQSYADLFDIEHQSKITLVKLHINSKRSDALELYVTLLRYCQVAFSLFASCLAFLGFFLWYNRIQKHIDKQMRNPQKLK